MTNSLCSWTVSFWPGRRRQAGRGLIAQGDGEATSELPGEACVYFHVCCSVYPPQAFGLVGPPTTEQKVEVH